MFLHYKQKKPVILKKDDPKDDFQGCMDLCFNIISENIDSRPFFLLFPMLKDIAFGLFGSWSNAFVVTILYCLISWP